METLINVSRYVQCLNRIVNITYRRRFFSDSNLKKFEGALYYYLTVYSKIMNQKMSKVERRLDVYYKRKKAYYYLDFSMVSDGEKKGSRKQTNCVGTLQTKVRQLIFV